MTDQPAQSGEEQLRTNESPHSLETTKQDSDKPSGGTGHETTASGSLTAKSGEEDVSERSPREDETGDDSDDADNDADDDADDDDEEDDEDNDEEDEDEEDEEEDEPHLKYARLTQHLIPVYRNGDATSAFLVAGDKMVGFDNTNSYSLY
jgi:phosphopantothenoylcysteine synthetase/decarboxylase